MKNKAKEGKWYSLFLYIPLFIILLPWILVVLIKDSMAERKRKKERREKYHDIYNSNSQLMPYTESATPLPNEEFVSRIDELLCIQYKSLNGLSGRGCANQVITVDDPIRKDQILTFLKEHPIENLLNGNLNGDGFDRDHWELRFIFSDKNLNRCIRGYGVTEISAPYLRGLIPLIQNNKD